jgi:preprotein translocase subunit SecE
MKVLNYFKESREELKKVVWPTRKEVIEMTLAVVIIVVFVATLLGFFDFILAKLLTFVLNLKK